MESDRKLYDLERPFRALPFSNQALVQGYLGTTNLGDSELLLFYLAMEAEVTSFEERAKRGFALLDQIMGLKFDVSNLSGKDLWEKLHKKLEDKKVGPELLNKVEFVCINSSPPYPTFDEIKKQLHCEKEGDIQLIAEMCAVAINHSKDEIYLLNWCIKYHSIEMAILLIKARAKAVFNYLFFNNLLDVVVKENRFDLLDAFMENEVLVKNAKWDNENYHVQLIHLLLKNGDLVRLKQYMECFPFVNFPESDLDKILGEPDFQALFIRKDYDEYQERPVEVAVALAIKNEDVAFFEKLAEKYYVIHAQIFLLHLEELLRLPLNDKTTKPFLQVFGKVIAGGSRYAPLDKLIKQKLEGKKRLSIQPADFFRRNNDVQTVLLNLDQAGLFDHPFLGTYHASAILADFAGPLESKMVRPESAVAQLILDYRKTPHLDEVEDKSSEIKETQIYNPDVYYKKYNVQTWGELIKLLPGIADDVAAIQCIFYNSWGYPDRENLLLQQLTVPDEKGRRTFQCMLERNPSSDHKLLYPIISRLLDLLPKDEAEKLITLEDNSGRSIIHIAMENRDKALCQVLTGEDLQIYQRRLFFDINKSPNPFDLAFKGREYDRSLYEFVKSFANHSPSAQEYLYKLYGPTVVDFSLPDEWISSLGAVSKLQLFELHALILKMDDRASQSKAIIMVQHFLQRLQKENQSINPAIKVILKLDFVLADMEHKLSNEYKFEDKEERNQFSRACFLAQMPYLEAQLAAINIFAEMQFKREKFVIPFQLFNEAVNYAELKNWLFRRIPYPGLTLKQINNHCRFKTANGLSVLNDLIMRRSNGANTLWLNILHNEQRHQNDVLKLFMQQAHMPELDEHEQKINYEKIFQNLFNRVMNEKDYELLNIILDNPNFNRFLIMNGNTTSLMVPLVAHLYENNKIDLLCKLGELVPIPREMILKLFEKAVKNKSVPTFAMLMDYISGRSSLINLFEDKKVPELIAKLLIDNDPKAKELLQCLLSHKYVFPEPYKFILNVVDCRLRNMPATIGFGNDFFNRDFLSRNDNDALILFDAMGVFGYHPYHSTNAAEFLRANFSGLENKSEDKKSDENIGLIVKYRAMFPDYQKTKELKDESSVLVLDPEPYYKKYHATTIDELLKKVPEIIRDLPAVECVIYHSYGYPMRQMECSNLLQAQDTNGRTFFHYLAESPKPESVTFARVLLDKMYRMPEVLAVPDNKGVTPVHLAFSQKSDQMLNVLCGNGQRFKSYLAKRLKSTEEKDMSYKKYLNTCSNDILIQLAKLDFYLQTNKGDQLKKMNIEFPKPNQFISSESFVQHYGKHFFLYSQFMIAQLKLQRHEMTKGHSLFGKSKDQETSAQQKIDPVIKAINVIIADDKQNDYQKMQSLNKAISENQALKQWIVEPTGSDNFPKQKQ